MITFHEQEVSIKGKVTLAGTITIPESKETEYPAVLIIPGSGTLDRDGNAKRGKLRLNLYRELADFLTGLRFVTLRYDKRGVGASEGKVVETGMWDLVDDAQSAVEFLREHPQVDAGRVIVLGHSEGSILATALHARSPVAGLVLLSGAGMKLDEAIQAQQASALSEFRELKGFKGFLLNKLNIAEKSRKKNEKFLRDVMNPDKDIMRMGVIRISSKWFREHFTYNLFEDYAKINCPVLAITGKKDFQADYRALENLPEHIKAPLEVHAIEHINHGLKEQTVDVSILDAKKLYVKDIGKDFHGELKELLGNWLVRNFKEQLSH